MAEVFIYEKPSVTVELATSGTPIDLECHAREVALTPEDSEADIETYCAPGATRPGKVTWTAEVLGLQSFGTDGFWNVLQPLARQLCTWTITPDGASAVAVDNPIATFNAYMPSIPFLTRAPIGEPAEVELTFTTVGEPDFATVPPIGLLTAEAGAESAPAGKGAK